MDTEWSDFHGRDILTRDAVQEALGPKRLAAIRRKMRKACRMMEEALNEVRSVTDVAEIYVDENNFHIMSGPSHESRGVARQDRILTDDSVSGLDCGAW